MILKDCWVFSPKIDASQNLCFTLKVKREDYTPAMMQFMFDCYNSGKSLDMQVVWLEEKDTEIPKLRQRLALTMSEYAQKTNKPLESIENALYTRYNVKSRTELTRQQLEECIEGYIAGLRYE